MPYITLTPTYSLEGRGETSTPSRLPHLQTKWGRRKKLGNPVKGYPDSPTYNETFNVQR